MELEKNKIGTTYSRKRSTNGIEHSAMGINFQANHLGRPRRLLLVGMDLWGLLFA